MTVVAALDTGGSDVLGRSTSRRYALLDGELLVLGVDDVADVLDVSTAPVIATIDEDVTERGKVLNHLYIRLPEGLFMQFGGLFAFMAKGRIPGLPAEAWDRVAALIAEMLDIWRLLEPDEAGRAWDLLRNHRWIGGPEELN